MPRPKKKKQYYVKKDRTIYLIKNPNSREFYIGHTLSHNIRSTYKDHYIETKYKTANMIRELKNQGLKPCCFTLEKIHCTSVQAYRYVIIWTKIFIEQSYNNLDTGAVIEYAADLLEENIPLYEERKNTNLAELIQCKNCLFPDYGRKICPLNSEAKPENE